jgi:endonuclease/exonuclease/phosphatase family metal-dependent hydrolase
MGNRHGAWDHLRRQIRPDFALLQEAQLKDGGAPGIGHWKAIANSEKYGATDGYRWGSAVWSRELALEAVDLPRHSGWVQAVAAPAIGVTLVSVHVELDRAGRSIPMLHRILSDLTPLLENEGATTILGGDLNADVLFDERNGGRRHALAFERLEDLGLWHCNRLIPPGLRRTFRPSAAPVMDDHIFVGQDLIHRVRGCTVLASEGGPSDHFPVLLDLDG